MPRLATTHVTFTWFYSTEGGASLFFLLFTLSPARFHPPFGRSLSLCLQGVGSRHQTNFFQKIRSPVDGDFLKNGGFWRKNTTSRRAFLPVPGAWRFFRKKRHNFVLSVTRNNLCITESERLKGGQIQNGGQLAGTVRRTTSIDCLPLSPVRGAYIFRARDRSKIPCIADSPVRAVSGFAQIFIVLWKFSTLKVLMLDSICYFWWCSW